MKALSIILFLTFSQSTGPFIFERIPGNLIFQLSQSEVKHTSTQVKSLKELNFSIECPCNLVKDFANSHENLTTYHGTDFSNEIMYRINVEKIESEAILTWTSKGRQDFEKDFLNSYAHFLKKAGGVQTEVTFKGAKAIKYSNNLSYGDNRIQMNGIVLLGLEHSYTLTAISQQGCGAQHFEDFISSFNWINGPNNENVQKYDDKEYRSDRYAYSIKFPDSYKNMKPIGKNIDLKCMNQKGAMFLINVSDRLPEEYAIDAHNLSTGFFIETWKEHGIQLKIVKGKKMYLDGLEAFELEYIHPENDKRSIEYTIYKGSHVFLITFTAFQEDFEWYRKEFEEILNSFQFKR